ncbi:hypothetical protein AQJ23_38185 [Streptomyces antibioticus]|nr:hypothetical protein [Streptomyces antibioticus]KUN19170.1 hypothetical protein AQJ23_38185 [Streptomyces antibioticus]
MRTGGAPALGAGVGVGVGFLAALLALGGCGGSGSATTARAGATTTAATPATPTPPEDLCTRLVAHWSREVLDQNTYGDYQSMGLSNGQYDILIKVVDAARAEKKKQGAAAADQLIDRQARSGCVRWYRDGGPGKGPWQ